LRHTSSFYLANCAYFLAAYGFASADYLALCLVTTIPVFFMKWPFVENSGSQTFFFQGAF